MKIRVQVGYIQNYDVGDRYAQKLLMKSELDSRAQYRKVYGTSGDDEYLELLQVVTVMIERQVRRAEGTEVQVSLTIDCSSGSRHR